MTLNKEQLTFYAAGVFDASGAISATRPIASASKDSKKHEMLIRLQKAFKGDLVETPGQGKGQGKIFIQWHITNPSHRKAFFSAIHPYSVAHDTIDRHLAQLGRK